VAVLAVLLTAFGAAHSTTWYVHPDSALNSIEEGLNSCLHRDTVLVAPGEYEEKRIVWPDVGGIHLISELGPDTTIIDGGYGPYILEVGRTADSATTIAGFTLRHTFLVGAVYCYGGAALTITDCVMTGSVGAFSAVGIYCDNSSPMISSCTIVGNTTAWGMMDANPYGIFCWESSPTIADCIISDNEIRGGIHCGRRSSPRIMNCILTDNGREDEQSCSGIVCWDTSGPEIIGCTISGNTGGGIYCGVHCFPVIDSCVISSNQGDGVCSDWGSSPSVSWSSIIDNTGYGVRNLDPNTVVEAERNWWGDASGPYHPITNPTGRGSLVSDDIDYSPWLSIPTFPQEPTLGVPLYQNHPNPFTLTTEIVYELPSGATAHLVVYNGSGQVVATLLEEPQSAGRHSITWNATDDTGLKVPSGTYFLRLEAGEYTATRKLVVVR
jgi:hypothetical protein